MQNQSLEEIKLENLIDCDYLFYENEQRKKLELDLL